jgi:hypothetical protein
MVESNGWSGLGGVSDSEWDGDGREIRRADELGGSGRLLVLF